MELMPDNAKIVNRQTNIVQEGDTLLDSNDHNSIDPYTFVATIREILLQQNTESDCKQSFNSGYTVREPSPSKLSDLTSLVDKIKSSLSETIFDEEQLSKNNLNSSSPQQENYIRSPSTKQTLQQESTDAANTSVGISDLNKALLNFGLSNISTPEYLNNQIVADSSSNYNKHMSSSTEACSFNTQDEYCNSNSEKLKSFLINSSEELVNKMLSSFKLLMQYIVSLQLRQKVLDCCQYPTSVDNSANDLANSANKSPKNGKNCYELIITALITSLIDILDCLFKSFVFVHKTDEQSENLDSCRLLIHKCHCIILATITYLQQVYFNSSNPEKINTQKDLFILSHMIVLCSLLQKHENGLDMKESISLDSLYNTNLSNLLWSVIQDDSYLSNAGQKTDVKEIPFKNLSNLTNCYSNDGYYAFDAQLKTHKSFNSLNNDLTANTGRGFRRTSTEYLCTYPGVSWNTRMQSWLVYYEDAKGRKSRTFNPKRLTTSQLSVLPPQIRIKYAKDPVVTAMHCACAYAARVRWEGKLRKSLCLHANKNFQNSNHQNSSYSQENEKSDNYYPVESFQLGPASTENVKYDFLNFSDQSNDHDAIIGSEKKSVNTHDVPTIDNKAEKDLLTNDLTTNQLLAIGLNTYKENASKKRRRENLKIK